MISSRRGPRAPPVSPRSARTGAARPAGRLSLLFVIRCLVVADVIVVFYTFMLFQRIVVMSTSLFTFLAGHLSPSGITQDIASTPSTLGKPNVLI